MNKVADDKKLGQHECVYQFVVCLNCGHEEGVYCDLGKHPSRASSRLYDA